MCDSLIEWWSGTSCLGTTPQVIIIIITRTKVTSYGDSYVNFLKHDGDDPDVLGFKGIFGNKNACCMDFSFVLKYANTTFIDCGSTKYH